MRTLIIGWGNPIAGSDGLGWRAAELVGEHIGDRDDVEVIATAYGGFRVAERMLGYDRVLVLDAAIGQPGDGLVRTQIATHEMTVLDEAIGHDGSLPDAIRVLRRLRADELPEKVVLLAAPVPVPRTWDDRLTEPVEEAALRLAQAALDELEGIAVA